MTLTKIRTNNLIELQEWCRDYHRYNKHPTDFFTRFAIGFYQIYQGEAWKDEDNRNESFAAAAVHFIMVSEILELCLEKYMTNWFSQLTGENKVNIDWKNLLCVLSKAQQHIFYKHKTYKLNPDYQRKSRYNAETLAVCLRHAIVMLLGAIKPDLREYAIEDATAIMTGRL